METNCEVYEVKNPVLLSFFVFISFASFAQTTSIDSLFQRSRTEKKNVFLVFSGSDWCANCIRFDKKILHDPAFKKFIETELVYLNADFPQQKKLAKDVVAQNEALAEKYNPKGLFPTLLLISPEMKTVPISYSQESAPQFIDKMKKALLLLKEND